MFTGIVNCEQYRIFNLVNVGFYVDAAVSQLLLVAGF